MFAMTIKTTTPAILAAGVALADRSKNKQLPKHN